MDVPRILQGIKMKCALYRGDTDIWWKQLTFTPFSGVYCIIFERENSISSTCTLISNWIMELYPVVFSNDEIPGPGGITGQRYLVLTQGNHAHCHF